MIAGEPRSEEEEIMSAIREICPDIGYIITKNGEMEIFGNEIDRVVAIVAKLSK